MADVGQRDFARANYTRKCDGMQFLNAFFHQPCVRVVCVTMRALMHVRGSCFVHHGLEIGFGVSLRLRSRFGLTNGFRL